MRITNNVALTIYSGLVGARKIKQLSVGFRQFSNWCLTLDTINQLDEDAQLFQSVNLENYQVPTFLKDFIWPKYIKSSGDSDEEDFLVKSLDVLSTRTEIWKDVEVLWQDSLVNEKEETFEVKILSQRDFNNVTNVILNNLRLDGKSNILETRKAGLKLGDVGKKISFNNLRRADSSVLVTYPISINPYRFGILSTNVEDYLEEQFSSIF